MKTNTQQFLPEQTPRTHEDAPAYDISKVQQLERTLMACLLWEDTFYENGVSVADRIKMLTLAVPPEAAAGMAMRARVAMKLRHAPLLVARTLAGGSPAQRRVVSTLLAVIIQRADELAEFVALYWKEKRQPLSAQVKKGLARAFQKFDAYQLAKYDRDGAIKLRDVLFLSHAQPKNEEQAAIWKQLVEGTLPTPDTWEVVLSSGADKQETWNRLLREHKLGGLALLRNLRNMLEAGADEEFIRQALYAARVFGKFARVLPFRFIAAARYAPRLEPEIEQAMLAAVSTLPKLPGTTVLLVDGSGSMNDQLSGRSEMTRFEAASALAILLREICENARVYVFSRNAHLVPARRGFALRDALRAAAEFNVTHTETAKQIAERDGAYDRIIIVTDEQSHEALTAPHGKGYVVNVASYQNGIGYGKWTHIDGWSEAVVNYIAAAEGVAVAQEPSTD